MDLTIFPYSGVGPIRFGMTVEQVRAVVGFAPVSFMKSPLSEFPTDAFDELGVHVYYKSSGICEAVEMGKPAAPVIEGRLLIGHSFADMLRWFKSKDNTVVCDETGLKAFQSGIGLYAPFAEKNPDEPVEGVLVFARGYWGEMDAEA
jgi:hypothetical protein